MKPGGKYVLAGIAALVTGLILLLAQLQINPPILLFERLMPGTGWIAIIIASAYAAVVIYKMQNPANVAQWRKITWLVFSIIFFSQLLLGLLADSIFLMTGKLHLPVPAMIIGGPVYRMQLSIMPLLFISTVVITGPAWCSHLCYFGGLDNLAASGRGLRNDPLKNKMALKQLFLFLLIAVSMLFNLVGVESYIATGAGILTGIAGIVILLFVSTKRKKMVHCTLFCPLGTLVNFIRYASPFRMYIDNTCTTCMACTLKCKYDALNLNNIQAGKPGITCTYCGDCISACSLDSIKYRFLSLSAPKARNLYLLLTISLHASFIFLARI